MTPPTDSEIISWVRSMLIRLTPKERSMSKNRNLTNLKRLSGAAFKKLPTLINYAAISIRDKVLDEMLNKHAERFEIDAENDAMAFEAAGALNAAREIAVALGKQYREAGTTKFNIRDWYQACGLDKDGELYDGLFEESA